MFVNKINLFKMQVHALRIISFECGVFNMYLVKENKMTEIGKYWIPTINNRISIFGDWHVHLYEETRGFWGGDERHDKSTN
jgi:hypothetical protein